MSKLLVQVERVEDLIGRVDDYFTQPKQKPKPQTNADRFRAMTDEEMAEYLSDNCSEHMTIEFCQKHANCYECWLDWLKQEAKK